MEAYIFVPCCQVDARFDPCGMGCGNAHELYGNAYERRDYFHGEWALFRAACGMRGVG